MKKSLKIALLLKTAEIKMKKAFFLCVIICGCMIVAGCGRMNNPTRPEGSTYPRTYY